LAQGSKKAHVAHYTCELVKYTPLVP